jgi:hypothetical protein
MMNSHRTPMQFEKIKAIKNSSTCITYLQVVARETGLTLDYTSFLLKMKTGPHIKCEAGEEGD